MRRLASKPSSIGVADVSSVTSSLLLPFGVGDCVDDFCSLSIDVDDFDSAIRANFFLALYCTAPLHLPLGFIASQQAAHKLID
jgi:hypothetical protein